nr:MAG TPA: hypothetical protein [Bacteriophage sp.]
METDTVQNTGSVVKNDTGFKSQKSLHLKPFSKCEWNRPIFLKIEWNRERL